MNLMVVLPVVIPLIVASIALVLRHSPRSQRWVGVAGMGALLGSVLYLMSFTYTDGIQVLQLGDWDVPFGITLVADHLSTIMLLISAIMGLLCAIYSLYDIGGDHETYGYYPLLHILMMGVNGSFLTGDLFNLYVWFEVLLISSFILLAMGNRRSQLQGTLKYVIINLVSSLIFLFGVAILYGMTGTLNMADLAERIPEVENTGLVVTVSMLFMVSFGIKAAIFPLFFWLPASYHTPPVAVSALFGGLLTKVGVYALIRVFTLIFTVDIAYTHTILLWIGGFTMVTGVLGAAAQYEFRKILSFHIVSQIGYMIFGLALYTPLALLGAIFYVVHNIMAKSNLFLISGVAHNLLGTFELKKMGGLYRYYPFLAVLFIISAFGLAGFPPLSGFWGKLTLAKAGIEVESYWIVAAALFVGMLTLFSMMKIWLTAFWHPLPDKGVPRHFGTRKLWGGADGLHLLVLPIVVLAVLILGVGVFPEPFLEYCRLAAEQLLNPEHYIEAVLHPS